MGDMLYTPDILRLAADRAFSARLSTPDASVERRAAVCGSRVIADVTLGSDGRIAAIGMQVQACALGQAAAALLAEQAIGRSDAELATVRDALTAWLAGEGAVPGWPRLALLAPALSHTARHAAIRLPFEAAAEAAELAGRAQRAAA